MIEVAISEEEAALERLARSQVERARVLLAYRETPSFCAVGRAIGVTHQMVERCLRRAERLGVMAALDDSPRPGREPVITDAARTLVVDLACPKAKDLGYTHELWTTRVLAKHIREHGPAAGHACLATLAQGTLCKILARTRSNRARCGIIWSAAIRNSTPRCPRSCASIARSNC